MTQAGKAVINQQEGTEAGASGDDLGAPFSLPALSKSAFTHHRPRPAVVLPPAVVRSPRVGPPGVPFLPSMDRSADATGGLCIERSCADALGAWGPSATNKLRRVYTGALLAITVRAYKKGLNVIRIGAILCSCQFDKV